MQVSKRSILLLVLVGGMLASCRKTVEEQVIYHNVIYEVDNVILYQNAADKTRQKTSTQYISILYADLFNTSISNGELTDIAELTLGIGDKTMANELIIDHYLNDPQVVMPSDATMRTDIPAFVEATYVKFYQRLPTEYERHYLEEMIADDTQMTVSNIYVAFMLANEYYFY